MPLAETGQPGFAAIIEDPVNPAVERDGDGGDASALTIGHQQAGERDTETEYPVALVVSADETGGTGLLAHTPPIH